MPVGGTDPVTDPGQPSPVPGVFPQARLSAVGAGHPRPSPLELRRDGKQPGRHARLPARALHTPRAPAMPARSPACPRATRHDHLTPTDHCNHENHANRFDTELLRWSVESQRCTDRTTAPKPAVHRPRRPQPTSADAVRYASVTSPPGPPTAHKSRRPQAIAATLSTYVLPAQSQILERQPVIRPGPQLAHRRSANRSQ